MSNAFWAWLGDDGDVNMRLKSDFKGTSMKPDNLDCWLTIEEFKYLFGLLPAEGQAMQIDPSDYPAHCPVCDAMYLYDGEEHHMTCRCLPEPSAKAIYHAGIMAVKNLEGRVMDEVPGNMGAKDMSENEKVDVDALRHEHDGSMRGQMIANAAADELVRLRAENAEIAKEANRMNSEINRLRKVEDLLVRTWRMWGDTPGKWHDDTVAYFASQDKPMPAIHLDIREGAVQELPHKYGVRFGPNCNPGAKGEAMPEVKPLDKKNVEHIRTHFPILDDNEYTPALLATLDSKDREIKALRGLIDTLSFCYDQPVSDLALMVNANKERDARENT